MALTIPQQRLTRFLVSGNKWSIRDAFCTNRLTIFSRYHSYSLHHPHSLRFTNFLSHPSLCSMLRLHSPPLRSMTTPLSDPPQSPPTKTVRIHFSTFSYDFIIIFNASMAGCLSLCFLILSIGVFLDTGLMLNLI